MRQLVAPSPRLYASWLEARTEWGPGLHEDGFGILPIDRLDDEAGFIEWVRRLRADADNCAYRWIVEDGCVLGAIALRYQADELGHLGYGIRPSERRRGVASWALRRIVAVAGSHGLDEVVAVCAADNHASARVLEANGGILDAEFSTEHGLARRYVITVGVEDRR